ncbi:MAG: deoxyribonuclease V [Anaerolineae bacterium]
MGLKIRSGHAWNVTPAEARKIQEGLRQQVVAAWTGGAVRTVAGVDVGIRDDSAVAAVVVLSFPELEPLESSRSEMPVSFPYIPGLLAFREAPAILQACAQVKREPDLLILDGQGLAHPRRLGIASHVGVVLDVPAIGCAKTRLVGTHHEPGPERGAQAYLYDREEIVGAVVRTKDRTAPVYVSIGDKIDLEQAIHYTLACCTKYRLPEPTRLAHQVAAGKDVVVSGDQPSLFDT